MWIVCGNVSSAEEVIEANERTNMMLMRVAFDKRSDEVVHVHQVFLVYRLALVDDGALLAHVVVLVLVLLQTREQRLVLVSVDVFLCGGRKERIRKQQHWR